jgi:hypothetical protein
MLNLFKSTATVETPSKATERSEAETLIADFVAKHGDVTKVSTTSKKKSRKAAKAAPVVAAPVEAAPVVAAPVETTPVVVAPSAPLKNIWGLAIAPAIETTAPAKKAKKARAVAAPKVAGEKPVNENQAALFALLSREEGATIKDIQGAGYIWAAMAVLKMAERNGYKTSVQKVDGRNRYFAKKA